jgi:hypothetical protein
MKDYIKAAIIDNVFGTGRFENHMPHYIGIVYTEMVHEFETHLLPMMMSTCRTYLARLPLIQANANFLTFDRQMSPIPIPIDEDEQKSAFSTPYHRFSAYGMPYRVENYIQKFRRNPILVREHISSGLVHPESRILLFLVRHDK